MSADLPHKSQKNWSESDRLVPRVVVRPLQRFMRQEAAGGIVMLVAAALALAWANSPFFESYFDLWDSRLVVEIGDWIRLEDLSFRDWINEGLMTIFFFLMAVEIKREAVYGELSDPRRAAVPVIAAAGGMVVPALIYFSFNPSGDASSGWGIPMATDIAFALAVVSLAGPRIPSAAKVFLLTLAIADDVGAILVIAVFYTSDLSLGWLAVAVGAVVGIAVLRRADIRALAPILALAFLAWLALLESGVQSTLAGVAIGLLIPTRPFYDPGRYAHSARLLVDRIQASFDDHVITPEEQIGNEADITELVRLSRESISPLERVAHVLEPWVAFVIVPLFALANAGVRVVGGGPAGGWDTAVVSGVAVGLLVGKPVGVFGATFLAVKLRIGRLPTGTTWRHIAALGLTAGIGFTVALFVAELAFEAPALADSARLGILVASLLAGVMGLVALRFSGGEPSGGESENQSGRAPCDHDGRADSGSDSLID